MIIRALFRVRSASGQLQRHWSQIGGGRQYREDGHHHGHLRYRQFCCCSLAGYALPEDLQVQGWSIVIRWCLSGPRWRWVLWKIGQKREASFRMNLLDTFGKGNPDSINPDLPLDEQTELLPYDPRWEFPRDRLKLGKQSFDIDWLLIATVFAVSE